MTAATSAGILLYRQSRGRPGGAARPPRRAVLAAAGLRQLERARRASPRTDEALEAVAAREFEEETGFELAAVARDPERPPVDLGEITLKSGKIVRAWAVEGDLDPALAHSNEIEIEWPPRTGRLMRIPEVDRVAWFGFAGGAAAVPSRRRRRSSIASRHCLADAPGHVSEIRQVSAAVARRFLVLRHLLAPPRVAAGGAGERAPGRRPARLAPVRPARGRRPQPRPGAARADRRLPPRVDRPLAVRGPAPVRDVQQEPQHRARRGAAAVPLDLGSRARRATTAARSTSTRRSSRSSSTGSGTAGTLLPRDVGAARGDRLVLAPDEPGPGDPRGARRGRASLGIARREGNLRVYDLAERLFPAEILAERRPEEEQQAPPAARRATAATACWARRATRSCGSAARATRRIGRRAGRRSSRPGGSLPVQVEGLQGRALRRRARTSAFLDQAEARGRDGDRSPGGVGRRASRSSRRSIRCAGTATCCAACSTSTTSGRSTSPPPKRRWGYYVLPILYGDRLVGRIEPRIERRAGTLRVAGLWWEPGFDPLGRAMASSPRSRRRSRRIATSRTSMPSRSRARRAIGRS